MVHATDRDHKSHSVDKDRYDGEQDCYRSREEKNARAWRDPRNLARGCDRDGKTFLDSVNDYLIECEALVAKGQKPYQAKTIPQQRAARDAGYEISLPARGETDWRHHHRKPFGESYVEKLCLTLLSDPRYALAFRAACRAGGR